MQDSDGLQLEFFPLDSVPSSASPPRYTPKRSPDEHLIDSLVDEVLAKCPVYLRRKLAIALMLRIHLTLIGEQERMWLIGQMIRPPF